MKKIYLSFIFVIILLLFFMRVFIGKPKAYLAFDYKNFIKPEIVTDEIAQLNSNFVSELSFDQAKKAIFEDSNGSIDKLLAKKVTWTGGLYYPQLDFETIKKATPARVNFFLNINLNYKSFGEGIVLVAYNGQLPENLHYEDNLRITGEISGLWEYLIIIKALNVEKI